jgi:hypothetical protein
MNLRVSITRSSAIAGLCHVAMSLAVAQNDMPPATPPPVVENAAATPAPTPAVETGVVIPLPYPVTRYEESWKKNPFLLKTAPVVGPTVSFADDWALANISTRDGKATVRIVNKKTGERKTVSEIPKEGDEFRLIKANMQGNYRESSAEVAKGDEVATLKYDESAMGVRAAAAPALPRPVVIQQQGQVGGVPVPGAPAMINRPGMTTQVNRGGGIVPSPAGQQNFQRPTMQSGAGGAYYGGAAGAPASGGNANPTVNTASPGVVGGVPSITVTNPNTTPPQVNNPGTPSNPGVTPTPVSRRRQLIPSPIPQQTP